MTAVYMVAEYFMDPVTCPTLTSVWGMGGTGVGHGNGSMGNGGMGNGGTTIGSGTGDWEYWGLQDNGPEVGTGDWEYWGLVQTYM